MTLRFLTKQDGMTAADVASINLHSDVYHVLQLMSPHDTAATKEHEVNLHSMMCSTIGMYVILSNVNQQNFVQTISAPLLSSASILAPTGGTTLFPCSPCH